MALKFMTLGETETVTQGTITVVEVLTDKRGYDYQIVQFVPANNGAEFFNVKRGNDAIAPGCKSIEAAHEALVKWAGTSVLGQ